MSAVIDGQVISHDISQKEYDKFLAVDDYHRMKLFSKAHSRGIRIPPLQAISLRFTRAVSGRRF